MITKQYHKIIAYVEKGEIHEQIKAKFFYRNDKVFYEVTEEIYEAIHKYNIYAQSYIKQGKYLLLFPFSYHDHYMIYPNGFGDTHYFGEHEFDRINKYVRSFPLKKCKLEIKKVKDINSVRVNKEKHLVHYVKEKAT